MANSSAKRFFARNVHRHHHVCDLGILDSSCFLPPYSHHIYTLVLPTFLAAPTTFFPMGYPSPIKPAIRKLSDNVVTVSCPFSILNRFDVGARMSLFNFDGNIVAFSPLPYGDYLKDAIEVLTGDANSDATITHLIIPNHEHNLAAKSYKPTYPNAKVIAGNNVKLGEVCPVDYILSEELGNKLLGSSELSILGLSESWLDDLKIIFLAHSLNKDVVVYHKPSKSIYQGDVFFNIGARDEDESIEQYSSATGYPENHYPFTGWSYLFRFLNPSSTLGSWLNGKFCKAGDEKSREGLELLLSLDFDVAVPCHGNIITKDAKEVFRKTLGLSKFELKSSL